MENNHKHQTFIKIDITPENIEKKQYICNEKNCYEEFGNETRLKKHILNHWNININENLSKLNYQYICPIKFCRRNIAARDDDNDSEYFSSRKHLIQHFHKVHNSEKFKCNKCEKKFSTEFLRNLHSKNCGKTFSCEICYLQYNSIEALITHRKRKNHTTVTTFDNDKKKKEKKTNKPKKRSVSTTTSSSILSRPSVGTNTQFLTLATDVASKSTITDDVYLNEGNVGTCTSTFSRLIRNSSTSTNDFMKDDNNSNSLSSSSSQNKKSNVNWSVTGAEFEEDTITLFDNDVKMEFYSAETQTDFSSESLLHNICTQTTFADFYDFEKFDICTQTNWEEFN